MIQRDTNELVETSMYNDGKILERTDVVKQFLTSPRKEAHMPNPNLSKQQFTFALPQSRTHPCDCHVTFGV